MVKWKCLRWDSKRRMPCSSWTIDVRGTLDGTPVTGRGYLEMTGYAGPPLSRVLR